MTTGSQTLVPVCPSFLKSYLKQLNALLLVNLYAETLPLLYTYCIRRHLQARAGTATVVYTLVFGDSCLLTAHLITQLPFSSLR